jgi:hypothetical protein
MPEWLSLVIVREAVSIGGDWHAREEGDDAGHMYRARSGIGRERLSHHAVRRGGGGGDTNSGDDGGGIGNNKS